VFFTFSDPEKICHVACKVLQRESTKIHLVPFVTIETLLCLPDPYFLYQLLPMIYKQLLNHQHYSIKFFSLRILSS